MTDRCVISGLEAGGFRQICPKRFLLQYEWHRESAQQLSNAGAKGTYFLSEWRVGLLIT